MTDSEKNPPDMPATTFVRAAIVSARPQVLLIHGAANSASAWKFFQKALARTGWSNHAIDLRGHGKSGGSVDGATMADYVEDVTKVAETLPNKPVVMGWSMGGLVALKFAAEGRARACVALSPTPPTRERNESVRIRGGVYGSEVYGIKTLDPAKQPAMPDLDEEERGVALGSLSQESRRARDERKAGVVIESMPCPLLVIAGSDDRVFPKSLYEGMGLEEELREAEGSVALGAGAEPTGHAGAGEGGGSVAGRGGGVGIVDPQTSVSSVVSSSSPLTLAKNPTA